MAWVSVHDNVIGGKLRELAKEMGCTQEEALGILVSLWIWSLNNADKDGKLMSVDREDVLEAFSMKLVSGLKVDLVDTLVKTRWMDEPEPGVLYIHDWDQWQEQWYKAMERREKDAKKKQKTIEIKEIRMSPNIDTNDLNTKASAARKFIEKGNRVKITLRFRGREMAHMSTSKHILDDFAQMLSDIAVVEKQPKVEGRSMIMFLTEKR